MRVILLAVGRLHLLGFLLLSLLAFQMFGNLSFILCNGCKHITQWLLFISRQHTAGVAHQKFIVSDLSVQAPQPIDGFRVLLSGACIGLNGAMFLIISGFLPAAGLAAGAGT